MGKKVLFASTQRPHHSDELFNCIDVTSQKSAIAYKTVLTSTHGSGFPGFSHHQDKKETKPT